MYIYRRLGGVSSPLGRPPRNREIVSFRACDRRAVSGCEEDSKCKSNACPLSLFPLYPERPSLVRSSEFK